MLFDHCFVPVWTILKLAMVEAVSMQYIGIPSIYLAKIFIRVALRQTASLLADYCRTLFLDMI